MKLLVTTVFTIMSFVSLSQRIGYEWIKTIDSASRAITIIDKENKLVVATDSNLKKFELNGNLIWTIADTLFNAQGIAVDRENNIYLTGTNIKYISLGPYSYDVTSFIYIAKYDKSGNRIWVSTTNLQTTHNSRWNFSTSIACDLNNSLYITGSYTNAISFDGYQLTAYNASAIFIAKYDTAGKAQWARKIYGTNASDALTYGQGNEIAIDQNKFVYVTGSYRGPFNFGGIVFPSHVIGDIFLTKFDSNGTFLKTQTFGGDENDEGVRLIFDKHNNLVMLAKFGDTVSINGKQYQAIDRYNNAIILKFVNDSIVFATQIGYSNGGEIISDICLDKNQDIIYTGLIGNWPTLYPVIYRINSSGAIGWNYMIAESAEKNFAFTNSIVSDTAGGIYLAGSFNQAGYFGSILLGPTDNSWHAFIGKIDPATQYPSIHFPENGSSILIYPTVTQGNLTIVSFSKNLENSRLCLYNLSGRLEKQFTLASSKSEISIDELSPGMYLITITGAGFAETFKIIKY